MNYQAMKTEVEIPGSALDKRNGAGKMFASNNKIGDKQRDEVGDQTEMDEGVNTCGQENNTRGKDKNTSREEKKETGYNREKPPEDDCCPICFGEFKVPCKANCGHWFCGSCILQLWEYRSRPQRCRCPFCSSAISKLTPEVSPVNKTEDEVVVVLKNIEQYNRFYVKGMEGCFLILNFYLRKHGPFLHVYIWNLLRALVMIVISAPGFIKRVLVDLIRHPERIRLNFQRVRLVACTLSLLLHLYHSILPPGHPRLEITKIRLWIDFASIILVVLPYTMMLCKMYIHIWWLRFRIWQVRREVAALRAHNAALRQQEAALRAHVHVARVQEQALEENAVLLQNNAALQAAVDVARQEQDEHGVAKPEASSEAEKVATSQPEADVILKVHAEAALQGQDTNDRHVEDTAALEEQNTIASGEPETI
ncbi:E3 ubiquitin-protein ligase [Sesamum alatum]|uniref:E3 ubiquitin-protein ligase n=1 Tax=Sesamum alatum TaxID=300844 RepID=A0AAE1YGF8_9LAMI|nr:E3 ubiquitin-protein ligase [Sesamum alatum]